MTEAYTDAVGTMINSGDWNGMESSVLKKEAPEMIEKMGFGRKRRTTSYVTGYSHARDTGANQFRLFTARTAAVYRFRKTSFRYCFLK